ncbi:and iron-dependent oxygenase domain-containing protein 2 [Seminavis robusta]|uniref:And iron-dependent oxygenase domain-containing protein 2 n=1 Tax=Seminavis robusta TaxID=568900 RepID=A0A9N8E616_9STRA|nr:and iron-dependent oxygenase domain-containing protein 2 [Seminavis robusta]|eukprot:Sro658_g182710.1 and iron-dependent oxygenase domain-containing protein 2 (333) ;mRNA; f:22726-23724
MAPRATTTANECHALEMARNLKLPSREEMLRRDPKVYQFWSDNEECLVDAWNEWQQTDDKALALPKLDESILNPKLKQAIEAAWEDPSKEVNVKDLWEEMAPGVYGIQFFDKDKVQVLREWIDVARESGIPTRPPYGIVLNRKGLMIDPRSVGYMAAPDFQTFYQDVLVDRYIRPMGRLLFPEFIQTKDDSESFAFSIQYQAGGDESIRPHSDASTITFNINLDLEQTWTGSSLYFWDNERTTRKTVAWKPGMAMIHLGRTMHAALPIETGTRSNLVIWTFAKNGGRGYGGADPLMLDDGRYPEEYQLSPEQRWSLPTDRSSPDSWDRFAPF